MQLNPFVKKPVSPGEPLTAQAWNDVLDGVDNAYKFLRSSMHFVRVKITNPAPGAPGGLDPETVRVVASRSDGAPVEAVRPLAAGNEHALSRLDTGAWTITAEAEGFTTATQTVNVTDTSAETTVEMALTPVGAFMPDLFSAPLSAALTALTTAAPTSIVRVLDFNGRELPPSNPGSDALDARVLIQSPAPGTPLLQGGTAWVVIAVAVPIEAAIEVPSLSGLTQQEAQKALEAIGLVLGKVTFMQKTTT